MKTNSQGIPVSTDLSALDQVSEMPPRPYGTWKHPTGSAPKTVMVVGLGPTKQDLLEITTAHEPNEDIMDVDEVWGINGGANHIAGRVAYDVLWVMDWIEGEARNEPRYARHLEDWTRRHQAPIITSQATGRFAMLESIHEYPLLEVVRAFGAENAYFHNSIPYIIAYALFIGAKRMILFGSDYHHEAIKRREDDRPCAEYWIGYARAKGMQIIVPSSTTLLNTNRGLWFYGYRDQPAHLFEADKQVREIS